MSKELEDKRFNAIKEFHKNATTDYQQAWATIKCEPTAWERNKLLMLYETAPDMVKTIDEALKKLLKLETPPTAEEVCKELSEWIEENAMLFYSGVYFDDKKKSFEVEQYGPSICYKDDELIWFNWFKLPPHLITLIGRFYEGLENV